ncbi:hypothetical protein NSK_008413 [Nannochloropsis salina CCMP1776]|uniref:Uncharacterized protein n=1 Tax=Nannochloropsis salina CCMP1776 TaxID=1027361 RepID=A0A4D9CMD2_9STRA|nr:hypothetical protein NSK_008413 [Nannochloropsis salina CCMP1776]|eukprot:TFJ80270.1 hypothetical protein NSK_008413 [Nannochloropsis salina CCMP1776]
MGSRVGHPTPLFTSPPQNVLPDPPLQEDSSASEITTSPVAQSFSPFLGRQRRRPGLLFEEEIDFCLAAPSLEGVSVGNSRVEIAKVVNTFVNQAAKKILIGFDCCFGEVADGVKDRLRTDFLSGGEASAEDRTCVEGACAFIDAVRGAQTGEGGPRGNGNGLRQPATPDVSGAGRVPSVRGGHSFLSPDFCPTHPLSHLLHLPDSPSVLLPPGGGPLPVLGPGGERHQGGPRPPLYPGLRPRTRHAPKQRLRASALRVQRPSYHCLYRPSPPPLKVRPRDRDICLSLYDTITGAPTKTKVLNTISNRVSRTMLYGDEDDVAKLTDELTKGKPGFLEKWVGGDEGCDEAVYYGALIAYLTGGLEAPAPAAMGGGYSNAYQRFTTSLVQELGTRSASVDPEMFDAFVRWESTLRKNLTQDMWDRHPKELTGQWTLVDSGPNPAGATTLPGSGAETGKGEQRSANLVFRRDGTLRVPPELGMDGTWSFEPGPTHLDTIRFELRQGTPDNRVLCYTGYVDRGQRIETRFSKRPIKMKGRVVLRARGEARSSGKFSMQLCKKNTLLENLVVGSTRGSVQE